MSIAYRHLLELQAANARDSARNTLIAEDTAAWASSAVAGTQVAVDIALPASLQKDGRYLVTVFNPSTETALTVQPVIVETLAGAARYSEVGSGLTVPVNSTRSFVVEGWVLGESARLVLSNDAAVGLTGAFTAAFRVRAV